MLNYLNSYMGTYLNNKKGQGMVEYALLIGLIAIVVIAVLIVLGPQIVALFQKIIDSLKTV
jgi:pilus assembly protein Flp/PilA